MYSYIRVYLLICVVILNGPDHPNAVLYTQLFALKHKNHALWNGAFGGTMVRIYNDKMDKIISFSREKDNDKVIPILNFSNDEVTVNLDSKYEKGTYKDLFSGQEYSLKGDDILTIQPWGYLVLVK